MRQEITLFVDTTKLDNTLIFKHPDLKPHVQGEFTIIDVKTTGVPPHYLAITYLLEKKEKSKLTAKPSGFGS